MISKIFLLIGLAFAQNSTYIKGPTLYESLVSIASTGGTTGLVCNSNTNIELTGTLSHNFVLPDATGCNLGRVFEFKNNSTLSLTIKTFGGATLAIVVPKGYMRIVLKDKTTSVGTWFYNQGVYPVSISRDTITDLTTGSIPFSDGLNLSQNNGALYWDNINQHFGIGTNAPQSGLEVRGSVFPLVRFNGDGSTYTAPPNNTVLHTIGANGHTSRIVFDSHNSGVNGSYLLGRHARGTASAPTAVNNGDTLMGFAGVGYGTTGYASNGSGYILIRASENFTDTSNATNLQFYTTPTTSISPLQRMNIASNGHVSIGSSAPATSAKLDIQGTDGALVIPRMTTAQKNALTATAGMIVYDTTLGSFDCYTTVWKQCSSGKAVGEVFMVATVSCPTGSIPADGASLIRTDYPDLFAAIGTTYGSSSGTTFNVPNTSGIFVRGSGSQTYGGETYSATLATKQNDATSKNGLTATSTDSGHTHGIKGVANQGVNSGNADNIQDPAVLLGNTELGYANITTTINAGDAETRPANIALKYCIVF